MNNGNQSNSFKRLNFFPGFFTTADDWTAGQEYHLAKRKLHNRALHIAGVLKGEQDELRVDAIGGFDVEVRPGAALDQAGNLILLDHAQSLTISRAEVFAACASSAVGETPGDTAVTVYIGIQYQEESSDKVINVQDPDYTGDTRVTERALVKWQCDPPNPEATEQNAWIEVARVALQSGTSEISDEMLDRSHVRYAGAFDADRDRLFVALHERIQKVHGYHLAQQQRHNQGLHTPGIVASFANGLAVVAVGGLTIEVRPGMAVDSEGNELHLAQTWTYTFPQPIVADTYYVAGRHTDHFDSYLEDDRKAYCDASTMLIEVIADESGMNAPDNKTVLELARIDLTDDAIEIGNPSNGNDPQTNEIDYRNRPKHAGSVGAGPPHLPPQLRDRLSTQMEKIREDFEQIELKFPHMTMGDMRYAALHLEMSLYMLLEAQLPSQIQILARLADEVKRGLGETYPPLLHRNEYDTYAEAVAALSMDLKQGQEINTVLNRLDVVTEKARDLSEVSFPPPIAVAGSQQIIETTGSYVEVELDASGSTAAEGQTIVKYRWEKAV